MAGAEAVVPEAPPITAAAASLLDYLANHNRRIGVDHYLRVERLLLSLAASDRCPESARELESWVRPIVCESKPELDRFASEFQDWLRLHGGIFAPASPAPDQPVQQILREVNRGTIWWVAAGLALLVVMAILLLSHPTVEQPRGASDAAATKIEFIEWTQFFAHIPKAVYLCIGIAGALFLAFHLIRRARLRGFLMQRQATRESSTSALFVDNMEPAICDSQTLATAARGFGLYRRLPSEDLDIVASVAATAREAGRFTPVLASRPSVPEYLILVDRCSSGDLFAKFADGIVRALEQSNVAIEKFYFDRTPHQCYSGRGHRPVSIRKLAERFPDYRVLVFSDGLGFLTLSGNQYGPWMHPLSAWETRTLLTPNPREHWSVREKILAAHGWTIASAEQEEIACLAHERQPDKTGHGFIPGVLDSVRVSDRGWLRRSAPDAESVEDLLIDLRISLGEAGFYWLCACAAYPAPDWNVTLYLGKNLRDDDGKPLMREAALLALSRLPWFRHGRMPEWLRLTLLAKLTRPQEDAVRAALQILLNTAAVEPVDTYRLEVDKELRGGLTKLTRQLLRQLQRTAKDEDSPVQDRVFVEFLSGRNPALSVPLPQQIHDFFRNRPAQTARRESPGRAPAITQLLILYLAAQLCISERGVSIDQGVAVLIGGVFGRRWFGLNGAVALGCLSVFGGALAGGFSAMSLSAVLLSIGFGLLAPNLALLLAETTSSEPRRTLPAFAIFVATVYVPGLLSASSPSSRILFALLLLGALLSVDVLRRAIRIPSMRGSLAVGAAVLMYLLAYRYAPEWAGIPLFALVALYPLQQVFAQKESRPYLWFVLAGVIYWTVTYTGVNQLARSGSNVRWISGNLLVIAMALVGAGWWRVRNHRDPDGKAGFALAFALLAAGLFLPKTPGSYLFESSLAQLGQPLIQVSGLWVALRYARSVPASSTFTLWIAAGFAASFLSDRLASKIILPGEAFLWGLVALAGVPFFVPRRRSAPLPLDTGIRPRTAAALCYWLVGFMAPIFPSYRRNVFVRFHATQAIGLYVVLFCCRLLLMIFLALFGNLSLVVELLRYGVDLGFLGSIVTMTIQAARGKTSRLPLLGRFAEKIATRKPKKTESAPASPEPRDRPAPTGIQVFLSYCRDDAVAVRNLRTRLREEGFRPWLDEYELRVGSPWEQTIPDALRASDAVVVCLSRSITRNISFQQAELRVMAAMAEQQPVDAIFLIPVRLEQCEIPDILMKWQVIDLFEPSGFENLKRALDERTRQARRSQAV